MALGGVLCGRIAKTKDGLRRSRSLWGMAADAGQYKAQEDDRAKKRRIKESHDAPARKVSKVAQRSFRWLHGRASQPNLWPRKEHSPSSPSSPSDPLGVIMV